MVDLKPIQSTRLSVPETIELSEELTDMSVSKKRTKAVAVRSANPAARKAKLELSKA
jgi:hypothetical protein